MSAVESAILAGVSRETLDDLRRFANLFADYASHTNLVARSTLPEIWERHILDSAQLILLKPGARRWLDLGSGGGFPGIVTAILLKDKADAHVDLVESTGKKAAFLRYAVNELQLPASIWNERIEAMGDRLPLPEFVSARALAPLPKLLLWASPWLEKGAAGLFHKGRSFAEEIAESRAHWRFDVIKHASLTDSESAVLEIREVRRRS